MALADVVVETDLLRWIGAFAERENPVQQPLDVVGRARIWIRTKVDAPISPLDLTGDEQARVGLIGNLDKGIGLVVLEFDVELGLVFLDQVNLQKQGLGVGPCHDKLKIRNLRHQKLGLGVMTASKIRPHPIFQVLGLAHVNNLPLLVLVEVAPRTIWKKF